MTFAELPLAMAIQATGDFGPDRPRYADRLDYAIRVQAKFSEMFGDVFFPYWIDDVIALANTIRKNMDTRVKIEVAKIHGTRCFFKGRGKGPCCEIAELGHIVPCFQGGDLSVENCMIECWSHNNQRRQRTIEEYLKSEDRICD